MGPLIAKEDLHTIQIDHNSTCNLRCPQCARISEGKANPELPQKVLDLAFYEKVFTKELCSIIERVYFCGNYGDVIASNNIQDVCKFLKSQGLRTINIVTSGSMRDEDWWRDLAQILNGPKDKVMFSIDGLEDTNALYRIGSDFQTIIKNAKAFIDAGGTAHWDYLVFAHNEHQVDEAKSLAKELGFKAFNMKRTNRFVVDSQYRGSKKVEKSEIHNRKSEKVGEITAPQKEQLKAKSMSKFDRIIEKFGTWENYINQSKITCKAQKGALFIDFMGDLWPCTWTAAPLYFIGTKNMQKKGFLKLIERYGEGFNSLKTHSLEEVLAHPWYANELTSSWEGKMDDPVPKLMTCGRTCGEEYEFSSNSKQNKEVIEF